MKRKGEYGSSIRCGARGSTGCKARHMTKALNKMEAGYQAKANNLQSKAQNEGGVQVVKQG